MKRFVVAAVIVVAGLAAAAPAGAHPLGNFTVNTAAEVRVQPDRVVVDHVVDLAEIPAFRAADEIETAGADAWAAARCDDVAGAVAVSVNGTPAALRVERSSIAFPAGEAGLTTIRLACRLHTASLDAVDDVTVSDRAFDDTTGWREITIVGDRTTVLESDAPATSPSAHLTDYPPGPTSLVRTATATVEAGGAAATSSDAVTSLLPRGADAASRSFTELIARREVTIPFVLLALGIAAVLGAMHAVAPGHGKTVMAAYLVGRRGTTRQGLLIGATVAVTHTAGVLAIGTGLWVSEAVAPERLLPLLGVASGVLLAVVGGGLLRGALARRGLSPTGHHHGHDHHHHGHDRHHDHHHHDHDHHHHEHEPPRRRSLVLLGFAGGMVPSPSALVVLLGALALGRAWLGVALVLAYGVGMALCLVGAGLLLARLGGAVEVRMQGSRLGALAFGRALPVGTASVVVVVGLSVAARSFANL